MRLVFRKLGKEGRYPQWVRDLDGKSGVYVIRELPGMFGGGGVVYVGESHAGRLRQTMTRHFQAWNRSFNLFDLSGWSRHTGHVYRRDRCEVAVVQTTPRAAPEKQFELIRRLKPRDNQVTGDAGSAEPFDY